jgi:uncharacterized damage-inducible protein DinB
MTTLHADQALFLRDFLLGSLKREHAITRGVIDAIPIDKGAHRPDAIVKSADDLAWHIVSAEHRFMEAVANGAFDFTNTGRPEELRTSADISRWYAETFARDAARLAALPPETLTRAVDFRGLFERPAVTYLHTAQVHSVHHRGQLSMYLRPMGAKVPAIYGESYDTAQAKKDSGR